MDNNTKNLVVAVFLMLGVWFLYMTFVQPEPIVEPTDQSQPIVNKANIPQPRLPATAKIDQVVVVVEVEDINEQAIGINPTEIMDSPGSKFDLLLSENDRLIIPKELQTVRLSGALLFPITVRYDNNYTFGKYISMSGGFSDIAKKKKTYVIYANGSVDKTRSFMFIKNYPDVAPGAEIVVPQKQRKEKMSTGEIIGITSALASMSLIIVTIINSVAPSN